MVLVVAGLLGSTVYKVEQSTIVKVKPGETASLNGYTLTYKGMTESTGAAELDARRRDLRRDQGRQVARHAGAAHRRVSR